MNVKLHPMTFHHHQFRTSSVRLSPGLTTCTHTDRPNPIKKARHFVEPPFTPERTPNISQSPLFNLNASRVQQQMALLLLQHTLGFMILTDLNFSVKIYSRSFHLCGDEGTRTHDLCLAKAPLSQLSYIPNACGSGKT